MDDSKPPKSSQCPWTRRRFLAATGAVTVGAVVGGCSGDDLEELEEDFVIELDEHEELQLDGGSKTFSVPDLTHPIGVTRVSEGEFIVTGTECNHARCSVQRSGEGWLCPCHGSRFTLQGTLSVGPATLDLVSYKTSLEGNTLTVLAG